MFMNCCESPGDNKLLEGDAILTPPLQLELWIILEMF